MSIANRDKSLMGLKLALNEKIKEQTIIDELNNKKTTEQMLCEDQFESDEEITFTKHHVAMKYAEHKYRKNKMKNKKPASQIITAINQDEVENISNSDIESGDDKKHKSMLEESGINPNVFMRYKKGQ